MKGENRAVALAPAFAVTLGTGVGLRVEQLSEAVFWGALSVGVLLFFFLMEKYKRRVYVRYRCAPLFYAAGLTLLCAAAALNAYYDKAARPSVITPDVYSTLFLQVDDTPQRSVTKSGNVYLKAPCRVRYRFNDNEPVVLSREYVQAFFADTTVQLQPGDLLVTRAKSFLYTGYESYSRRTYIYRFTPQGSQPTWRHHLKRFRAALCRRWGTSPQAALLKGICLGYKADLDTQRKAVFSAAGASHIMAVSGLHVGILYASLRVVAGPFALLLVWVYAALSGFSPGVVRAVIVLSLFVVGKMMGRRSYGLNAWALAALIMLTVCPGLLHDLSFQLSFCAVGGLLLFFPALRDLAKPKTKVGQYVWEMVCCSVGVQLGTVWLTMGTFGTYPVYGVLSNLVVIPLCTLVLYAFTGYMAAWGLGHFVATAFFERVINALLKGMEWLANVLEQFVNLVHDLPFAQIEFHPDGWQQALFIWITCYVWLLLNRKKVYL